MVSYRQGCREYGDSHGYGHGMDMGIVMNPHGPVGSLWRLSGGRETKRKRVTRDECRSRCLNFAKYSPVCNLFYWHFFSIIITACLFDFLYHFIRFITFLPRDAMHPRY